MTADDADTATITTTTEAPPTAGATLSTLDRELRVARATELARAGHRHEAAQLLEGDGGPRTATELDLLARIKVQSGQAAEAEALWARAADGDDTAYRAQRTRAAALARRGGRPGRWRRVLLALLALLVVAAVVLAIVAAIVGGLGRSADGREVADLQARNDDISRQLAESREAGGAGPGSSGPAPTGPTQPGPAPPARLPADLAPALQAAGFDVRPEGTGLSAALTATPFAGGGDTLTPQGQAALTELGRRLAPLGRTVTVRVTGHTAASPDEPATDAGVGLGYRRAGVAARTVAASSGIPVADIPASSVAGGSPAFPGGDLTRNRTVTVEIAPR